MKKIGIVFLVLYALSSSNKGYGQFKSHMESKFRGFGLVYNTLNVNDYTNFKYIDSMPFSKDRIASMDNNEPTNIDGSFIATEKDPAWNGISAHIGFKLQNKRKYYSFGAQIMRYNTDRYSIKMTNYYRNTNANNSNSDMELINGTINYNESATVFGVNFGYFFETPPILNNEKLYFFAGISPEIGYSFGRKVHRVLKYSSINLNTGIRKDINIDETETGKNFLYAQVGPTIGAEFLFTELSGIKLHFSPGFGISSFNNIRSTNNFFEFAMNQKFSMGLTYVYYFRD